MTTAAVAVAVPAEMMAAVPGAMKGAAMPGVGMPVGVAAMPAAGKKTAAQAPPSPNPPRSSFFCPASLPWGWFGYGDAGPADRDNLPQSMRVWPQWCFAGAGGALPQPP